MQVLSNICFCFAFVQNFLREMSEKDNKIKSLVNMGFPEDEAKKAIDRCGMLLLLNCYLMIMLPWQNILCCIFLFETS